MEGGGTDTQNVQKPEARFESVSLGSVSCLPAAHFLSVHRGVAEIAYDTWPPCGHRGSHLLRLLRFVSDTFCAWRHACYLSSRRSGVEQHFICHLCVSRESSLFSFLLMNSRERCINNVQRF